MVTSSENQEAGHECGNVGEPDLGIQQVGETPNYHLSFSGCGFQGLYHIGVASCIQRHAPYLFDGKVAGCSAGGLIAACAVCECKLSEATRWSLDMVRKARSRTFGPFHPSFDLIGLMRKGMEKFLPPDAHLRCNGRLHLSLTTLPDRKNKIVSHFSSREELMNALVCTCWIPLFAGLIPPIFEGQRYIDGGFTCNLPLIDDNTITVAPFSGAADICPSDDNHTFNYINVTNLRMELTAENVTRFARIFYPPNTNEVLNDLCKRGYNDAFKYLQNHKLMSCQQCLNSSVTLFNLAKFPRRKTTEQLKRQLAPSAQSLEVAPILSRKRTNSREQIYIGRSVTRLTRNSLSRSSHLSASAQSQGDDDAFCENCPECRRMRDEENAILPEQIVTLLQNFTMNESLYNQICEYKIVQLIGFITLPIRLPLEAIYVTGCKLYNWLPSVSDDFGWFIYAVNSAVKDLMEKTGTNLCFARLHLELVNVKDEEEEKPTSRPVSYCSVHSNPASRRSSISFEAIEQFRSYTSRNGSTPSLHDDCENADNPSLTASGDPRAEHRRMSFDLTFGLTNITCQPSGAAKLESMDTYRTLNFPDSQTDAPKIVVELMSPTGSESHFEDKNCSEIGDDQSGYSSTDDVIFFETPHPKVEGAENAVERTRDQRGDVPELKEDGSESTAGSSSLSYDVVNCEGSAISSLKGSDIRPEEILASNCTE